LAVWFLNSIGRQTLKLPCRPELRSSLIATGSEYVARHAWEQRKRDYLELVDSLPALASRPWLAGPSHAFTGNSAKKTLHL
jgi:hypothetical protein